MTSKRERHEVLEEHQKLIRALYESLERESDLHRQLRSVKEKLVSSVLRVQVAAKMNEADESTITNLRNEVAESKRKATVSEKQSQMAISLVQQLNGDIAVLKKNLREAHLINLSNPALASGAANGSLIATSDGEVDDMMVRAASPEVGTILAKAVSRPESLTPFQQWKVDQFAWAPDTPAGSLGYDKQQSEAFASNDTFLRDFSTFTLQRPTQSRLSKLRAPAPVTVTVTTTTGGVVSSSRAATAADVTARGSKHSPSSSRGDSGYRQSAVGGYLMGGATLSSDSAALLTTTSTTSSAGFNDLFEGPASAASTYSYATLGRYESTESEQNAGDRGGGGGYLGLSEGQQLMHSYSMPTVDIRLKHNKHSARGAQGAGAGTGTGAGEWGQSCSQSTASMAAIQRLAQAKPRAGDNSNNHNINNTKTNTNSSSSAAAAANRRNKDKGRGGVGKQSTHARAGNDDDKYSDASSNKSDDDDNSSHNASATRRKVLEPLSVPYRKITIV